MDHDLSISYFGRRGGGAHFTHSISVLHEDLTVLVSAKNSLYEQYGGRTIPIQGIPSGIIQNMLFKKTEKKRIIEEIINAMGTTSISIMQHPLDNFISKRIFNKKNNISVIHDVKAHPGDFWPNFKSIKKRAELSSAVITLTKYSRDVLYTSFSTDSEVLPLLGPVIMRKRQESNDYHDLAFFGRRRKYKGNENFIRAVSKFDKPLRIVTNILTLKEVTYLQNNTPHQIDSYSSWIEEELLIDLISESRILVLPYTEASQSGWIPIARDLSVPVIASNVGGLSEQFVSGRDGILVNSGSSKSLKNAIQSGLNQPWHEIKNMEHERNIWRKYLKSI